MRRILSAIFCLLSFTSFASEVDQALEKPKQIHSYDELTTVLNKLDVPSVANLPTFQYPNKGYESLFSKDKTVTIIGYGSLLKQCASNFKGEATVSQESVQSFRPVICCDIQRRFDLKDLKKIGQIHGDKEIEDKEIAYLNVHRSKGSFINAVARKVDLEDLKKLIKRERGYDLVPVMIVDWQRLINKEPITFEVAYVFMASEEKRPFDEDSNEMVHHTDPTLLPERHYVDDVKDAADKIGPLFSKMYDETTFLADGKTHIYEWDRLSNITKESTRQYEEERRQKET